MSDAERRPMDPDAPRLPRAAAALLRALLPYAERREVLEELAAEYGERRSSGGGARARLWVWGQVARSVPALARRDWWRGWSGFETEADRLKPGGAMFETWAIDVKFTLRRLWKRPTYTVLTVLTLALGVAGSAAVFGVTKRLLLEPLPVRDEEQVVLFWFEGAWNEAEFVYLRPEMSDFESVAAFRHADVTLRQGDAPARLVKGISATAEVFEVLGVRPVLGPGFQEGDDRLGTAPLVVLSHSLWRDLGARPQIVGEQVELSGVARTVVGVLPEGFWFPDPAVRVYLLEQLDPENTVGNYGLIARMPPGATIASMGPQLERITRGLDERFEFPDPAWDLRRNPELIPITERLLGSVRPSLLALLGAMAVILLIACVNVAALMLGQVEGRTTELAVRSALGAGRRRLIQQLVAESVVLGALAAVAGAVLAVFGFRFLLSALPLGALAEAATLDWSLFAAAIGTALVAATLVALAPAFSLLRSDLQRGLTRGRTAGIAGRGGRLEHGLVVAQVALVLLLASGAALLIRSVENLRAIEPGVDTDGIAVIDVQIPASLEWQRIPAAVDALTESLRALPGVVSVAATQRLPLRGSSDNWGITVEGKPELSGTTTAFRIVTPRYFETMDIRVLSGRGLLDTDRDPEVDEGVVVINEALAAKYFPGEDPIGKRIGLGADFMQRVVGVVENVAENDLSTEPVPARYMTYEHVGGGYLRAPTLVVRTREGLDPATILDPARRAIQATSPGVAIRDQTTMAHVFDRAIGPALQVRSLLALLAGLALTLGAVGIYGVVSHFVTRRRRDWGIRIALGMRPARVARQIVARGGALVVAGIAIGLIAFLGLARLLGSFLYGVGAADPLALLSAAAVLLGAGVVAAYVPARRASRVDPARVLREQ